MKAGLTFASGLVVVACASHGNSAPSSPVPYANPSSVRPDPHGGILAGVIRSGCKETGLLIGARLVLKSEQADSTLDVKITNGSGRFALGPVAPGRYRLLVRAIGHSTVTRVVDLVAGRVDSLDITLRSDPNRLIEDCVVIPCPEWKDPCAATLIGK